MKILVEMSFVIHLLLLLCPVYVGANLKNSRYRQHTSVKPGLKTWTGARSFCRKHDTDLVFIKNKADTGFIFQHYGWIGLYRDGRDSVWKWSYGDETANFTIWAAKPNNYDHCGHKDGGNIGWRTSQCNAWRSFICYRETLILVKENKTWEDALEHCRSLAVKDPAAYNGHRYDMATLLSSGDLDYAREMIQEATTDMVWTGLRFLAGQWMWVSGEQLQHTIERCEDNEACGGLDKNHSEPYKRSNCERKFNFLCSWRT